MRILQQYVNLIESHHLEGWDFGFSLSREMCQVAQTSLQPSSFDAKGGTVLLGGVSSCSVVFGHLLSGKPISTNFKPLQITELIHADSFPVIPHPELKYAQL